MCPVCLQPREKGNILGDALGSEKKPKIARNLGKLSCSPTTVLVELPSYLNSPIYKCGSGAQRVREPAQSHTAEKGPEKEPTKLDAELMPKPH